MRNDDGNPSGVVIFLIVALPIVIGALIGFLTYTPPPHIHHHATSALIDMAYTYSPIVP